MSRRPRLTIPRRVFLAFALMLTVSGLVSVASLVQHQRTAATLSLVHEGYLPVAVVVSEARATQSVFGNLLERVLSERNATATLSWLSAARVARPRTIERALDGIARIENLAPPAHERASLARLRRELRRVETMLERGEQRYADLYAALEAGERESAERTLADLRARERAIDGHLGVVWATVLRRMEETSARAADEQDRALAVLVALVVLAMLVGIGVTWWSQRVLSPLPTLQERVEAVARGDFARRLGPNTNDEIGRLGREFERMVAALAARDESLKSLQQMQAQILADLRAAVLVVDGQSVLRSRNPAAEALFELPPEDAGDPAFADTSLPRRIDGLSEAIEEVATGGAERAVLSEVALESLPDDLAREPADHAERRQLDIVVTPFGHRPEPGTRRDVLIVAEDVTDALRTKARLIQSERLAAIGRMAAHVTHEVRNPLSSIGLNMEMLEEELTDASDEARELVAAIHREIEHLTAVTEEYLRVARLPNPQLEPEFLGDIIESMAEFMRPELSAASVDLQLEVEPDLPLVALDETQIRQVLLNLLKNAREAMPDGGRLTVQARSEDGGAGGVVVRVTDEGAGMTPEERARIFDLFYTTKETGTGLGLPLSQQIVVAHGGLIRCESAPGRGTTFELWFPAHEAAPAPPEVLSLAN
ncbi:MAG: ATP-binding protein [Myxococcales bacterium]|jgi:signal transduction histidine kinase